MQRIADALRGRVWAPAAVATWIGAWAAPAGYLSPSLALPVGLAWGGIALLLGRAGRTLLAPVAAWLALLLCTVWLAGGRPAVPTVSPPEPPLRGATAPLQVFRVQTAPLPTDHGVTFDATWLASCPLLGRERGQCRGRQGRLRVRLRGRTPWPAIGDVIRGPAFVAPPPGYGNPGSDGLRQVWRRRGLVGRVKVFGSACHMETAEGAWLNAWHRPWRRRAGQVRSAIAARLSRAASGRPGAILRALSLGDRGGVDPELRRFLRDSGTAHILAVSGAHVSLLVALVVGALRVLIVFALPGLLRRYTAWQLVALPGVMAAWAYVLLTGAAESTIRAAAMITIALMVRSAAARFDLLESIGLAGLLLVLLTPSAVRDVGLQLSILGVLGVNGGARIASRLRPASAGRSKLVEAFGGCVGAALTTTVVALPTFGQLPLLGPFANLLVVPLVALVLLPLALLAAGLMASTWLLQISPPPWSLELLNLVATWSLWPLDAAVAAPPWLWCAWRPAAREALAFVVLLPLGALTLLCLRRRPARAGLALLLLFAVPMGLLERSATPDRQSFEAWFFDVGHGDATLLRLPGGMNVLVDGGGETGDDGRVGDRALLPALRHLGVDRVHVMVLTHPHPDHENGLLAVARALPVDELWWTGDHAAGKEHPRLLAALKSQGTRWRRWPDGTVDGPCRRLLIGGVEIKVVWPPTGGLHGARWHDANDRSLVLEVSAGDQRLLLSGDVEGPAERALLAGGLLSRPIALLKVPHHGSLTSSSPPLLRHLAPILAIAGARSWGQLPFPHPAVRARYADHGIALWPTERGAVHVRVTPRGWCADQSGRRVCAAAPLPRRPDHIQPTAHNSRASKDTTVPATSSGAL